MYKERDIDRYAYIYYVQLSIHTYSYTDVFIPTYTLSILCIDYVIMPASSCIINIANNDNTHIIIIVIIIITISSTIYICIYIYTHIYICLSLSLYLSLYIYVYT